MSIRSGTQAGALAAIIAVSALMPACTGADTAQPPTTTPTSTAAGSPTSGTASSGTASSGPSASTRPTSQPPTGKPACGAPTLHILAPTDGSRVSTPFPVSYEIRCFPMTREGDGTIQLTTDGMRFDLHPQRPSGTLTVPDHPMLSGQRTVTIQLARPNGQPLTNPEATTVLHLTIEGSR